MALLPQLNILDYRLLRLTIIPTDSFSPETPHQANITSNFALVHAQESPQRFQVALYTKFFGSEERHNLPYTTEVHLVGEFFSIQPLEPKRIPAAILNNALMLLYGTARGIVGQSTALGIHGLFVLPSVTFEDLVDQGSRDPELGIIEDDWLRERRAAWSAARVLIDGEDAAVNDNSEEKNISGR